MGGLELLDLIVEATGLEQDLVRAELKALCLEKGLQPEHLTLHQLRGLMVEYLQTVLPAAKLRYTG